MKSHLKFRQHKSAASRFVRYGSWSVRAASGEKRRFMNIAGDGESEIRLMPDAPAYAR
ncbi:MAG: hypothetical protein M1469_06540 [Bacteroidetes bacterium]|nr:hypothetical protein [Bacteroidota bacterium]